MKPGRFEEAQRFFLTGVSLITSDGPYGQNVMAAEWTMQVSYKPLLIAVFIHEGSATLYNIKKTKKFGINLASEDQSTLVSTAGGYSRKEVDKLKILGMFDSCTSKSGITLIKGCVVVAQCELYSVKKVGDHTMVVGKVLSTNYDPEKKPLIYHRRRYFRLGRKIEPRRKEIKPSKKIFDFFNLGNKKEFISRYVGVLVASKGKILVHRNDRQDTHCIIPCIRTPKNHNMRHELESYLKKLRLGILLNDEPRIRRLALKNNGRMLRVNIILFVGTLVDEPGRYRWKPTARDAFLKSLIR